MLDSSRTLNTVELIINILPVGLDTCFCDLAAEDKTLTAYVEVKLDASLKTRVVSETSISPALVHLCTKADVLVYSSGGFKFEVI